MKINKDNYEAFFLDYFEGNLSPADAEEMFAFIGDHPEVRDEFDNFEMISLQMDSAVTFENKDALKKAELSVHGIITSENIDEYLVAEAEHMLNSAQDAELGKFLEYNPQFSTDRKIYAHTILVPDNSIKFPLKEDLKHKALPTALINESNYEEFMVREVEDTLTVNEHDELEEFLRLNPELNKERRIYGLTKLQADKSVVFAGKSKLKQTIVPLRKIVYYSVSLAASVILLFSVYRFWNFENQDSNLAGLYQSNQPMPESTSADSKTTIPAVHDNPPAEPAQQAVRIAKHASQVNTPVKEEMTPVSTDRNLVPRIDPVAYAQVVSHDHVAPEFTFIRTSQMHSNEFLELYYNIKLSEQIQYAQLNQRDSDPEKTIFNAFTSRVGELFAMNKNENSREDAPVEKKDLSVWTFAELGVKTYNNLAHDNVKLDLNRDETGKVVSYNIYGDKLDLQKAVVK